MSYSYERFGSITLPTYNRAMGMAPVGPRQRLVATAAGAFDGDGAGRAAQQFPHQLTIRAIVSGSSATSHRDELDALRAAVGTRANLYRRADDDSTVQRALCRLVGMAVSKDFKYRGAYQPVDLQFVQLGPWRGAVSSGPWTLDGGVFLDEGYVLDSSTTTFTLSASAGITVANAGNLPVHDVVITALGLTGAIGSLLFAGTGWAWSWTGALVAGSQLRIDCAAEAVTLNGADSYATFTLLDTHTIERWIVLAPGGNNIYVTMADTASMQLTVEYSDGWA